MAAGRRSDGRRAPVGWPLGAGQAPVGRRLGAGRAPVGGPYGITLQIETILGCHSSQSVSWPLGAGRVAAGRRLVAYTVLLYI